MSVLEYVRLIHLVAMKTAQLPVRRLPSIARQARHADDLAQAPATCHAYSSSKTTRYLVTANLNVDRQERAELLEGSGRRLTILADLNSSICHPSHVCIYTYKTRRVSMSASAASLNDRYTVVWYKPADPVLNPTQRKGDYSISGLEGVSAMQLKAHVVSRPWPAATLFEVERLRQSPPAQARCYIEQIQDWKPSRKTLPASLPLDLPVSLSTFNAKFRDLINDALLFALEHDLLDEKHAWHIRRRVIDELPH
jgi:hypothetical protein